MWWTSEYCTVRIKALDTGKLLDDTLESAQGDRCGRPTGNGCSTRFSTTITGRPKSCAIASARRRHAPIYEETDAGFFLRIGKTESGRFIRIDAHDHADTSEVKPALPKDRHG